MYTQDEILALQQRERELMSEIDSLRTALRADLAKQAKLIKAEYNTKIRLVQDELRKVRKPLYTRKSYEKAYGQVKQLERKSPEELREYNRIKQREWRAKHKKEKLK